MDAILADPRGAALTPRWRAIADFAIRLTEEPAAMREADVQGLRAQGLTDAGVHDAVAITAYFNFVNRLADGLNVPLEEDSAAG